MAPHSLDSTSVTGIQTRRGHLPSSKRLANTSDASLICAQISNVTTITITKYKGKILAVKKNKFEVNFDFDGEQVWVDYKVNEWQRETALST